MTKKSIYIIILSAILCVACGVLYAGISRVNAQSRPFKTWIVSGSHKAWVTAYSSSPDETDDTPFVAASGTICRDGIIAANFLPMGAKVRIPALFGNKIFTVEDRMHPRFSNRVDVWFATRSEAYKFGKREVEIVVL